MEVAVTSSIVLHIACHNLSNPNFPWTYKKSHLTELFLIKMTED